MSILHLCNTFFEYELAGLAEDILQKNPIFEQLQFLPYLYAAEDHGVLASQAPDDPKLPTYTFDDFPPFEKLETWGHSQIAKDWADKKGIAYSMPPFDVVKMVNSKTYSFSKSPLPGSRLIYQGDPIDEGMILKSCFGVAGRGLVFANSPRAKSFCENEWAKGLPVIGEPWAARTLDFSTQWIITPSKEIAYLGATVCKTSSKGVHISNRVGDSLPAEIEEQKSVAMEVLQEMADMGYFGEVGFDAMLYDKNKLQPIVEINARKTMGWVTLMLAKKLSKPILEVSYVQSHEKGPLPTKLGKTNFSRQIVLLPG